MQGRPQPDGYPLPKTYIPPQFQISLQTRSLDTMEWGSGDGGQWRLEVSTVKASQVLWPVSNTFHLATGQFSSSECIPYSSPPALPPHSFSLSPLPTLPSSIFWHVGADPASWHPLLFCTRDLCHPSPPLCCPSLCTQLPTLCPSRSSVLPTHSPLR